jgi:Lar family restriction alleviation protein
MMTDVNELMPCPFCGSNDVYITANSDRLVAVRCSICPAMTESGIVGLDEIIKAWNTRHLSKLAGLRESLLDEVIVILKAEPETIATSASYRQGYARCSRDKVTLIEALKDEL